MPRDGLALAIRVGGQNQPVGPFQRPRDFADPLRGLRIHLPLHGEIVLGIHGSVLRRQIAHVTVRGQDLVVPAEILVDGLRLGRRFDDDESVHALIRMLRAQFRHSSAVRRKIRS